MNNIIRACVVCLLLAGAAVAQADGMLPVSAPQGASAPAAPATPMLNQPWLILKDGRWLVAGNSPSWQGYSAHLVGAESELWDPVTGQWQTLGSDLRFEAYQAVYCNQLKDGRVLFFAVREGTLSYQARIWDPKTSRVENIAVNAKPVPDDGIAVLDDGRVLIVDSLGGSADLWDSRSNTVTRNEVSELENLSWRALALDGQQVLLVEKFPNMPVNRGTPSQGMDGQEEGSTSSTVLLWHAGSSEAEPLSILPVPFRENSGLVRAQDGAVQVRMGRELYQMQQGKNGEKPTNWEWSLMETLPPQPAMAATPGLSGSAPVPVLAPARVPPAAEAQSPWWSEWVADDFRSTIFFLVPILWLIAFIPFAVWLRRKSLKGEIGLDSTKNAVGVRRMHVVIFMLGAGLFSLAMLSILILGNMRGNLDVYRTECALKVPQSANDPVSTYAWARNWAVCVNDQSGLTEMIAFYRTERLVNALPATPCRYVGNWSAHEPASDLAYNFTLSDNGRFSATRGTNGSFSGVWGAAGGYMVLIVDPGAALRDRFYTITQESGGRFTLVDEHGWDTNFVAVGPAQSRTCNQ